MFNKTDQTPITEDLQFIDNQAYKGYSYLYGKTFVGAIRDFPGLFKRQDMSSYRDCLFIIGTNDVVIASHRKNDTLGVVRAYLKYSKSTINDYGFERVFIVTPFYFNHKASELLATNHQTLDEANHQVKVWVDLIKQEISHYPNVFLIDISNLFIKDNQLFHDDYSNPDGVHFNDIGKSMYIAKINESLSSPPK